MVVEVPRWTNAKMEVWIILLLSNEYDNHDTITLFQVVCHNILNLGWLTNLFVIIEDILVKLL